MQVFDIIVLVVLIAASVWGAMRGLVKQLASAGSLLLGYFVAISFRQTVAPHIPAEEPWNLFAAMTILFVATSLGVWIVFGFVKEKIEKNGLTNFDTQLGGLLGLGKGILVAMVMSYVGVVMLSEPQRNAVLNSYSGKQLCKAVAWAEAIVPAEWEQVLQPYLEPAEQHQQQHAIQFVPPPLEELGPHPDPFETNSPSDHISEYEDPLFGILPGLQSTDTQEGAVVREATKRLFEVRR